MARFIHLFTIATFFFFPSRHLRVPRAGTDDRTVRQHPGYSSAFRRLDSTQGSIAPVYMTLTRRAIRSKLLKSELARQEKMLKVRAGQVFCWSRNCWANTNSLPSCFFLKLCVCVHARTARLLRRRDDTRSRTRSKGTNVC